MNEQHFNHHLNHVTLVINSIHDKKELKKVLIRLSSIDNDFSSFNGDEYLRDEARAAEAKSNALYYADKFINQLPDNYTDDNVTVCISNFLSSWLDGDANYGEYDYDLVQAYQNTYILSFAVIIREY